MKVFGLVDLSGVIGRGDFLPRSSSMKSTVPSMKIDGRTVIRKKLL